MVFGADLSQKAEGIGFVAEQAPCIAPGTHPGHGSHVISFQTKQQGLDTAENICGTLCANDYKEPQAVALQPIAVDCYNQTLNHTAQAISSAATDINHTGGVLVNISNGEPRLQSISGTPDVWSAKGRGSSQQQAVLQSMVVRRLTPVECERLQGFPDNFTRIPWRNKPSTECPDGPRYKSLGNSMAVPVMRWIGERIHAYNNAPGVL
jgi:DNA (cytosine-5)-methyltransferase 1